MEIRRIAYALAARITGVDLKKPLGKETVATIRGALLEHLLICIPSQDLSVDEFQAFAAQFGSLQEVFQDNAVTREVEVLTNQPVNGKPWDGYKNGQNWHTDRPYCTKPPSFSVLNCKQTPEAGGDTMFANMYRAYETLSPTLRRILDGLEAIHDRDIGQKFDKSPTIDAKFREEMQRASLKRAAGRVPTAQPVARIHPETKKRALYLSDRIRGFAGMTVEESRPLLEFLMEHSISYEFVYRHRWTVGDLVMWDNRCLMHIALCDYDLRNDPRSMLRLHLEGEDTGYDYHEDNATGVVAKPVAAGMN